MLPSASANATGGGPIGGLPEELLTGALGNLTVKQDAQAARLACHAFKRCSAMPFGRVLGNTTFNMRITESWDNLASVSRSGALAPQVKSLHVGVGILASGFPGCQTIFMLDEEITEDDVTERIAVPELWKWKPCYPYPYQKPAWHVPELKRHAINEFAEILSKFKNLQGLTFHDRIDPKHYEYIMENIRALPKRRIDPIPSQEEERINADRISLDILIHALANAHIKPKILTFKCQIYTYIR